MSEQQDLLSKLTAAGGEGMEVLDHDKENPFGGFHFDNAIGQASFKPNGKVEVTEVSSDSPITHSGHHFGEEVMHTSEVAALIDQHMAPLNEASNRVELVENNGMSYVVILGPVLILIA